MTAGIVHPKVRCKARKSDGKTHCSAWAVRGRFVCRVHGGASPAPGPNHPNFKHGRYSKVVPPGIAPLYHAGLADPRLLEMNDELALLDGRAAQLINRVKTGESEGRWQQAQEAMRVVLSFSAQGDEENTTEAIGELSKILFAGSDYDAWREVLTVWDLRRRVSNTERSRLQAAQQTVTIAQLMGFVGALSGIINSRIADSVTRAEIAEDIRRLLSREGHAEELPEIVSP